LWHNKRKEGILIIDIAMPVLNGIEAAKELKRTGCKSKVIFLTAQRDPDFIDACLTAGALE
jgi:DNA-binding NarL/FixJ family response regulator